MALSRGVFHPRFRQHHTPVVESSFLATVSIAKPAAGGTYDFETGETVSGVPEVWYTGPARVQRVAKPVRRDFVYDTADNQTILVQVTLDALPVGKEWISDLRVEVTACAANPELVGSVCYVRGWAGSSNALSTDLFCSANQKDPE